ncbi:MAG: type I-E CRISPR-associated protein Cas7/Cse4/CasC [Acidobacteriota bacterium]
MPNSAPSRFLQFHTLVNYPAALLNRDDAGFAKRLPLGGAIRTRISSQCLKRHWRTDDGPHSLATVPGAEGGHLEMTVRSRRTFEQEIYKPLVDEGVDDDLAHAAVEGLLSAVLQQSKASKKKAGEDKANDAAAKGESPALRTGQVLVLGRPEVDYFLSIAREVVAEENDPKAAKKSVEQHFKKEGKKNLGAICDGAGLDAALFGRMITSDILARCDAAIHVAHAFTVHREDSESDYFSAVDDLAQEGGETGSGHINSAELTSGLYYSYVVVDVPLLVSNLTSCRQDQWTEADRDLAAEVVSRLVQLVSTVSPGAKLGSTAPYARPHLVLVEAGDEAPRSLANAFLRPVSPGDDVVHATYEALHSHLEELDHAYGAPGNGRRAVVLRPTDELADLVGSPTNLNELATWAADRVR